MSSRRIERINHLLRGEISQMLSRELSDPRLGPMISVTEVITAPDMGHAQVYVSHLVSSDNKNEILAALSSAAGFIHNELVHRLSMKIVPELSFSWDASIEHGAHLLKLIEQVVPESSDQES